MLPRIYAAKPPTGMDMLDYFKTQGLGTLVDTVSCHVTQTTSGISELELTYPSGSPLYDELKHGRFIVVKVRYDNTPEEIEVGNTTTGNMRLYRDSLGEIEQPFYITGINYDIDSTITVKAVHLTYKFNDFFVFPMQRDGLSMVIRDTVTLSAASPLRLLEQLSQTPNYLGKKWESGAGQPQEISVIYGSKDTRTGAYGTAVSLGSLGRGDTKDPTNTHITYFNNNIPLGAGIYGILRERLTKEVKGVPSYEPPLSKDFTIGQTPLMDIIINESGEVRKMFKYDVVRNTNEIILNENRTLKTTPYKVAFRNNLVGINLDINTDDIVTTIIPYKKTYGGAVFFGEYGGRYNVFTLSGSTSSMYANSLERVTIPEITHNIVRTLPIDVTPYLNEGATQAYAIYDAGLLWAWNNKVWQPRLKADISFITLETTEEYKNLNVLKYARLGDPVRVEHDGLNVIIDSRITRTVWNVLKEDIEQVSIDSDIPFDYK